MQTPIHNAVTWVSNRASSKLFEIAELQDEWETGQDGGTGEPRTLEPAKSRLPCRHTTADEKQTFATHTSWGVFIIATLQWLRGSRSRPV